MFKVRDLSQQNVKGFLFLIVRYMKSSTFLPNFSFVGSSLFLLYLHYSSLEKSEHLIKYSMSVMRGEDPQMDGWPDDIKRLPTMI